MDFLFICIALRFYFHGRKETKLFTAVMYRLRWDCCQCINLCFSFLSRWENEFAPLDVNQHYMLLNHWHSPPPDSIKVNVNDSLLSSYKYGIGGVFRNCKGRFLLAFGQACVHWDAA